MAEALLAVWGSSKNIPHGQIIRQNAGKKQGGRLYETQNTQVAQYPVMHGDDAWHSAHNGVC